MRAYNQCFSFLHGGNVSKNTIIYLNGWSIKKTKKKSKCAAWTMQLTENKLVFRVTLLWIYFFLVIMPYTDAHYMCTPHTHTVCPKPYSITHWRFDYYLFIYLNALFSSSFCRIWCLKIEKKKKIHKCWWHWILKQFEWLFFHRWSTINSNTHIRAETTQK